MDFTIPDLTWQVWLAIGAGVLFLGIVISKTFSEQNRLRGFLTVVMYVAAGLCGLLSILQLLKAS